MPHSVLDYHYPTSWWRFVWWEQMMVWWEQTMVWWEQTMVWSRQTMTKTH
ncbi:hypothetical protein [Alloprevotella tannerae]|nr:hypothetical protein [Alloprevotella tannerae]